MLTQKVRDIPSSSSIKNLLQARGRTASDNLSLQSSTHIQKQFIMNQLKSGKSFQLNGNLPKPLKYSSNLQEAATLQLTIVVNLRLMIISKVIGKVKQLMSLELRLFPKENREKVYNKFAKRGKGELPAVLFFHREKSWKSFKQYMLIGIDPGYTLFQLIQMLQVKLIWGGYLTQENKTLFLNIGQTQLSTSMDKKIKEIYQTYKGDDGWLQLSLSTLSAFG